MYGFEKMCDLILNTYFEAYFTRIYIFNYAFTGTIRLYF